MSGGLELGAMLEKGEEGKAGISVGSKLGVRVGLVRGGKGRRKVLLEEGVKERFWEVLDDVVRSVPSLDKIVIAGDFNGHIGVLLGGYDSVHEGFGFGERNGEEASLLDFVRDFRLVVVNLSFPKKAKKEDHLITF
ncbi:uncharacterized protein LOC107865347 [Capsicum annuum]|uniref:uncharacterized protein LOC107865347 n=1 Tax=Capsicum annuum TaxID=4072 RepID=UPI0007BF76BC|nr:uncharacterized protein LOC107865347 [Capsicum annuum]